MDEKNIRKHKTDIFRLTALLIPEQRFKLPQGMKNNMQIFADSISDNLPDKSIFRHMGMGTINIEEIFQQLKNSFSLD